MHQVHQPITEEGIYLKSMGASSSSITQYATVEEGQKSKCQNKKQTPTNYITHALMTHLVVSLDGGNHLQMRL